MQRFLVLIMMVWNLSACSFWSEENALQEEIVPRDSGKNVSPATPREMELKLARLWAKVDELEQRYKTQAQRVKILEKGLMLGLVPEELKSEAEHALKSPLGQHAPVLIEKPRMPQAAPSSISAAPGRIIQPMVSDPSAVVKEAQMAFEQGRYGRAISLYAQLEGQPGHNHLYWIGLCWFRLKEFENAHKVFMEFIGKSPESPWIPRAEFNLARVDYELGYRERAVKKMQEVISRYPNEDAAQMARATIKGWEKAL